MGYVDEENYIFHAIIRNRSQIIIFPESDPLIIKDDIALIHLDNLFDDFNEKRPEIEFLELPYDYMDENFIGMEGEK